LSVTYTIWKESWKIGEFRKKLGEEDKENYGLEQREKEKYRVSD